MRKSLILLPFAIAVSACSSASEGPAVGSLQQDIIGGKNSTDDQDAVVLVVHTDRMTSFASCTGTLIAPNLVLTARHCVSQTVAAPFSCDEKGKVASEGGGGTAGPDLKPTEFYIFKGKDRPNIGGGGGKSPNVAAKGTKVFHDSAKVLCGHDLSLILLDRNVEDAKIMPLRLDEGPKKDEAITAVGWGVTKSSDFPSIRQTRSGIKVVEVGPFAGDITSSPLPPNDFAVGESICSGDSGGPGIAEDTHAIVGVVSRGGNGNFDENNPAAGCVGDNTSNIYTSLAPFRDTIMDAFNAAGAEPWIEGQPDPRLAKFDVSCSENAECRSNLCVDSKCTSACESNDDCPSGYECADADGDSKVCKVPAPKAAANNATTGNGGGGSGGCNAGAGPVEPVLPWLFAGVAALLGRRRRASR